MTEGLQSILQKMERLQTAFAAKLGERVDELGALLQRLDGAQPPHRAPNCEVLRDLEALAHSMAGSAGTFKFDDCYAIARELELYCSALRDDTTPPANWPNRLYDWHAQLSELVQVRGRPEVIETFTVPACPPSPTGVTLLLVDDDELVAALLQEHACHFGYQTVVITEPTLLVQTYEAHRPAAVIMDIAFPGNENLGLETVRHLKQRESLPCPVIFLSHRGDFKARLEAVRAGGAGFLTKPVDILRLLETLDHLIKSQWTDSLKVLVIDDEPLTNLYLSELLQSNGMLCQIIDDPLHTLAALIQFQPDLVVLDINMPGCDGFEVAEVIRQNPEFSHIPILFLAAEGGNERIMAGMAAGGDNFIEKRADTRLLIAKIRGLAQRSRALQRTLHHLNEAEMRFRAITSSISDAIVTVDEAQRIVFWNEGAERIFGYRAVEILGLPLEILIPSHIRAIHTRGFQRLREGLLPPRAVESEALTKNGRLIHIELTYNEWIVGRQRFFTSIMRDVSARKQLEQQLRQHEIYYHAVLDNSAEAIVTIDQRGIIEMVNPHACQLFGYRQEELIGQNVGILMPQSEREQHQYYLDHSEIYAPRIINKVRDLFGLRKDGTLFPLELNVSPMFINNERKYVGIMHDITAQKEMMRQLILAKNEAERVNLAKSQFLSSMSHELRTPLNSVLGFTQLLLMDEDTPLNDDQRDCVEHIHRAGTHLLQLINEVLDLAKIESGKVELKIEDLSVADIVAEVVSLVKTQALTQQIQIENQCGELALMISADRFRLKQILLNLLSNAIKYNVPNGRVVISALRENAYARILIKDTGLGISAEQMQHIFEPFNRLGRENRDVEGTGIGLSITKQLVEMLGGKIGLCSTLGQGSEFWISVPLATV